MLSMIDLPDAVGLLGALVSIYCYGRVQWQRDFAKRMAFSLLNLFATILMFFSLSYHWNLASFISNVAWCLISMYGVYRCMKYIVRARHIAQQSAHWGGPEA